MPWAPAGTFFMGPTNEILIVSQCSVGEGNGWLVAGLPRNEPDVSIFQGPGRQIPSEWSNYGIFYDREDAFKHARLLDYLFATAASFEAGQKKS